MPQPTLAIQQEQRQVTALLEEARRYIDRDYLSELSGSQSTVVPPAPVPANKIRLLHLKRIVFNTDDVYSNLISVFHTLSDVCDSCFLLICGGKVTTELYLGLRADDGAAMADMALQSSLRGILPGTEFESLPAGQCEQVLSMLQGADGAANSTVASVTQVPSSRSGLGEELLHSQGLERFIDAMKGQVYQAMVFAVPLSAENCMGRREILENLYSSLSAMEKLSYQYGDAVTISAQHSLSESLSQSISNSIASGYSHSTSQNSGHSRGGSPSVHLQMNAMGLGYGVQSGTFQSTGTQTGTSTTAGSARQEGIQIGVSKTMGMGSTQNRSITLAQTNKTVSELLLRLDEQMKRIKECETFGLWECCAFFAAPAPDIALVAANIYRSLTCGPSSGVEQARLNLWWASQKAADTARLLSSLQNASMPVFQLSNGHTCNAGAMVSGSELPLLMHFPLRPVCGLPVVSMAGFGREITRLGPKSTGSALVEIGSVCHMGRKENTPIQLNIADFSAHTMVVGTTGVGKSTLMSILLTALHQAGVRLMIVEPAKGEYRKLLSSISGLQVFTTDPLRDRMLRLNPFQFGEGIQVLSHIDRLMEVFSVCWPLYAAQPALLRECIEEAYIRTGWDLGNSVYVREGPARYPNFRLLLKLVPQVVDRTHFVGETRGTYEGALLTRLSMLAHGVFGQVFNGSDGLSDQELFDQDTVVDLSCVGSQETVSLLMGVLIVRLREFRARGGVPDNQPLRHVMVLEEAHNIFQRDTHRGVEGGETVAGKSVQMLAQCIAELRSYGQGFFIVDQSPGAIDIAAIRNTATKVVMRLPEAEDQLAMKESLSLTEEQTRELARLPEQTALVYQTGWLEPVMVRIKHWTGSSPAGVEGTVTYRAMCQVRGFLVNQLLDMESQGVFDAERLCALIRSVGNFRSCKKAELIHLIHAYQREYTFLQARFSDPRVRLPFFAQLIMELLACDDLFRLCPLPRPAKDALVPYSNDPRFQRDCIAWRDQALQTLEFYTDGLEKDRRDRVIQLLLMNGTGRQITVHNTLYGKIKVS